MPLRAAVFDFDGVIVDSEPVHYRAMRDALLRERVEITEEDYLDVCLAFDDRVAIRNALEHKGERASPERIERVEARKVHLFSEMIPDIPVFPGARDLVGELAAEVPLAIASGARHDEIEAILDGLGLRDAFQAIVGAEDAERTKPDPAPYLEAARRLAGRTPGLAPAECLAFEDSMAGIDSALGAGMMVVGVAHSYPAERLRAAHRVVGSLVGVDASALRGLFARP
ncbi:MAG TPA: HAD family phosphatase [Vicinamibacteria bacterium]|nr:HAD family phosphatase [Vicinamibacteria bacterium]